MVYNPEEDSYLLAESAKKYIFKLKSKNIKILDLGTGSGFQSKNLIDLGIKKENITASDIDSSALNEAKELGVKTIKSNLFSKIKEKYDLIIFNPPYLPEDKYDKRVDTAGGKKGDELILKFIKQLKNHLTKKGVCFLLTSSLTPEKNWKKIARLEKLNVKKIASKKLFFEELYIWKITKYIDKLKE